MGLEEIVDPNFLFMVFCNAASFVWGATLTQAAYKAVLKAGDDDKREYGFTIPATIAAALLPAGLVWNNTSYLVGYLIPALLGTISSGFNVVRQEGKEIRKMLYPT